jgi:hypothetical protein
MPINGKVLESVLRTVGLELVTRAEWGARAPKNDPVPIWLPSMRLWVHHAAIESTDDAREVRAHQAFHMDSRGWNDIAYSLLIPDPNPDLLVFEGRGIGVAGGHTANENTVSHGICVLGNFMVDKFSATAEETLVRLARLGRDRGWWIPTLGGHRNAPGANTSCPGDNLYNRLAAVRIRVAEDSEEDNVFNETDKTILRNIIRQELYGDDAAHSKGLTAIIREEVRAVVEEMISTSGSVVRQEGRVLAKLGAEDALKTLPPE